jgi:hypothetical protein
MRIAISQVRHPNTAREDVVQTTFYFEPIGRAMRFRLLSCDSGIANRRPGTQSPATQCPIGPGHVLVVPLPYWFFDLQIPKRSQQMRIAISQVRHPNIFLTKEEGRWGVKMRSSFAPLLHL